MPMRGPRWGGISAFRPITSIGYRPGSECRDRAGGHRLRDRVLSRAQGAAAVGDHDSVVIWTMVFANIWGPRIVGGLEATAMLIGLAPVLVIGLGGWFYFNPEIFWASWNVSGRPRSRPCRVADPGVLGLYRPGERRGRGRSRGEPKRNLPIAAVGGVAIAAVIYVLSCTVLMGIVPARDLAASSAPFALVATRIFGPAVATLIVFTTMLKRPAPWRLDAGQRRHHQGRGGGWIVPGVFGWTDRRGIPVTSFLIHGVLMTAAAFATVSRQWDRQFNK